MRIAIPYHEGDIFQHFGKAHQLKIYELEDGSITDSKVMETRGVGHGALALVLNQLRVETLICGGIGSRALSALHAVDIEVMPGASGDADAAAEAFMAGTLTYDPDISCEEEEEPAGCSPSMCGSCGSRTCGG